MLLLVQLQTTYCASESPLYSWWEAPSRRRLSLCQCKLWSRNTLTKLFEEAGFNDIQFRGVGRLPSL
jgi:hypothetical protein